ncbi:MAG: penicillin acylase family protein, partial [Myxococcota bacterium]
MKHMNRLLILLLAASVSLTACDPDDENNGGDDTGMADAEADTSTDTDDDAGDTVEQMGYRIPDLSGPVDVSFDEQGVLHVDCQTNDDCYAVQGYFHAAHRFSQMDLKRRLATGRLSAMLTIEQEAITNIDVTNRHLLTTRDGEPLEQAIYDNMDETTRSAIDAYSRGVNAWLGDVRAGRNGARLSPEYEHALVKGDPEAFPDWQPTDSVAAGLTLLQSLTDFSSPELRAGRLMANVDPDVAQDYVTGRSISGTSTVTASGETYPSDATTALQPPSPQLDYRKIHERLKRSKGSLRKAHEKMQQIRDFQMSALDSLGSNNWVMGPDQTATGEPILANDPHLPLTNPALWYLVELDSKTNGEGDLHVSGASFSGVPSILLGHNESIAWGGTVVFYDLGDVYTETLSADGEGVMFNGQKVPFEKKTFTVTTASGDQEREVLYVPHHGPVLSIDREEGTAVSFRWMVHDARTDLMMFEKLGRASSIEEARTAIELSQTTNQNWVVIDTDGNIGWFPYATVPSRSWDNMFETPYWLPLPGDGTAEWDADPIPLAELPQMQNPTAGFIATANQDMSGALVDGDPTNDGYTPLQTIFMAPGVRHTRIIDLIEQDSGSHTVETNQAIQGDSHIWLGAELAPEMLNILDQNAESLSAGAENVRAAIENWNYTCPTGLQGIDPESDPVNDADEVSEAIGCSAFHVLFYKTLANTFDDELSEGEFSTSSQIRTAPLYWLIKDPTKLRNQSAYWDDVSTDGETETQADVIVGSAEDSADILEEKFSSNPDDWLWGRIHTAKLDALLFDQFIPDFNHDPVAAPGGLLAVNVANPSPGDAGAGDYGFGSGPSMRHVATVKDGQIESYWTLPGGQRVFRDSSYYDNLLEPWTTN